MKANILKSIKEIKNPSKEDEGLSWESSYASFTKNDRLRNIKNLNHIKENERLPKPLMLKSNGFQKNDSKKSYNQKDPKYNTYFSAWNKKENVRLASFSQNLRKVVPKVQ